MAKLSVIVPIYGVEKYLNQAIDSILNQTLQDIEIILIDDGSKDNCPRIIDEYASKNNKIIAIHKENGGYGQTMNLGLKHATGEYIAILEPDDYIDSKMYEDLYNIAKEFDSDIVKSCFYHNLQTKEFSSIKKQKWKDAIPNDRSFTIKEYPYFLSYHPSIWSCIYKKEFLEKHNINFVEAKGAGWTDNLFQVQTMCLAEKINYTQNAYYYWRRLNLFDSDDIKDYAIPFKRSDEIHKWLEDNNINDKTILSNLYKRELSYIKIVLGMKKISDKKDCYNCIKLMCERMDKDIIFNDMYIDTKTRKWYLKYIKNPGLCRFGELLKKYRKNLIRVRINKEEPYIILFGKNILRSR